MRYLLISLTALTCAAADLAVPDNVILERGIDYASIPHGKLAMDIVRPKAPGKYPAIIMINFLLSEIIKDVFLGELAAHKDGQPV